MFNKETKLINATPQGIREAAEIIKNGGLVAIPTETVYGLAANALSEKAVAGIFTAKGRAQDNPLIVHVDSVKSIEPLVKEIPEILYKLADAFWPGPLTIIMKKSGLVPNIVTCGLDSVAIRIPSHKIASEVIKLSGSAIAAPSANLSGSPSPTTAKHCFEDLNTRVDAVLDGGISDVGVESTVLDITLDTPKILRPGFVTFEEIREFIPNLTIDNAVLNPLEEGVKPSSPGMKYKHYSPNAKVVIIKANSRDYCEFVNQNANDKTFALCFDEDIANLKVPYLSYGAQNDEATQATNLFTSLREFDEMNAQLVYAHCPSSKGVGLAVLNRLLRAAAFEVITL